MITLMHRYQRAITIAVTICTISTFVFFGSARAITQNDQPQEVIIWEVGGCKLSSKNLAARARFLSSEMPNGLKTPQAWCAQMNPGFISEWFLESGLASEIIESNPIFKADIESCKIKESHWEGYQHPFLGYLTYDSILSQFNPPLAQAIKAWKTGTETDISKKIALYKQARAMPLEFYTTIIKYYEASLPEAQKDPGLGQYPMTLFGYDSIKDWFGESFVDSCVKMISLGAYEAKKLGYDINSEDVRLSIQTRLEQIWASLKEKGMDMPLEIFKPRMFSAIGMNEDELTSFWRDLVLFECFYRHEGSQVLVDPLACEKMAEFVSETREVELYEIPNEYRVSTFESMAQLQLYWNLTTGLGLTDIALPSRLKNVSDIAGVSPELIAKKIALSWKKTTLDEIAASLGAKKLIILQAQDNVWEQVSAQIHSQKVESVDERIALLSKLSRHQRGRVDEISLKWLLENDSKVLLSCFDSIPVESQILRFPLASTKQPLSGISNAHHLLKELENSQENKPYTQDGMTYYLFEKKDQVPTDELIGFLEAKELAILDALLAKKMTAHYEIMKGRQAPALYKEGKLLEFSKVRQPVLLDLFQPLLVELQNQSAQLTSQAPKSQIYKINEADQLSKWRYATFLKNFSSENYDVDLTAPWAMGKAIKELNRSDVAQTPLTQVFELSTGDWTFIELGNPLLYQKARLVEIKKADQSKEKALWLLGDQTQGLLNQKVSAEYMKAWAIAHGKEWQPQKNESEK